jgi:predicted DNA-binding protein
VKAKLKAVALDSGRTEAAIAREALERFLDAA